MTGIQTSEWQLKVEEHLVFFQDCFLLCWSTEVLDLKCKKYKKKILLSKDGQDGQKSRAKSAPKTASKILALSLCTQIPRATL